MRNKLMGALMGMAVGDALGVPVEFKSREELARKPVKGMREFGTWNQPMGTWSDDTSMALCLTESLLTHGFDLEEQGILYSEWFFENKWTPHGRVFDCGGTCGAGIRRFMDGVRPSGATSEHSNGNGSLMRTLPLSLWLAFKDVNTVETYQLAGDASAVTHAHPRSRLGCALHARLVRHFLETDDIHMAHAKVGMERNDLFKHAPAADIATYSASFDPMLAGKSEPGCRGDGYVVNCFQAALWSVLSSSSFEEAVLKAVNLGDDTDTTGAVAGGLAGLVWGLDAIPAKWINVLARRDDISDLFSDFAKTL